MSAKKVRRHIRQLKKERRQELRRAARQEPEAVPAEPVAEDTAIEPTEPPEQEEVPEPPEAAEQPEPLAQPEQPERTRRPGAGVRAGAVLATLGILGVVGGSVALDPRGGSTEPGGVAAAAFPAADSGTAAVCPPMPGLADSLSTDGLLQYRDRDDSAAVRFQALVLAADAEGTFPAAWWAQLGQEYRVNTTELTDPEESESVDLDQLPPDPPALGELDAVYESFGGMTRAPLLEVQGLPSGVSGAGAARYTYLADSGPVTGLATATCTVPQRSQWFFGPEVGAGSTSLLTLANPFDRPATVEVVGYDADGHRGSSGTRTLVVPGESVRTVNIAALAGSDPEFAVAVQASGAPVSAQLQSSRAVGLTGQGIDFLPGRAAPAAEHVMPGIPVPESTEEDPAPRPAQLWIHAPGDTRTTMEVQVYGADGVELLEGPAVFTVEPGEVDTVDLRGLDAGVYDVVVRSDEPTHVAASSHGIEGGDPAEDTAALDFSWQVGATPLSEGSGALIPDVGESELRLTSLQDESRLSYRLLDEDGEFSDAQEVTVPAEGELTLSPDDLGDAVAVVVDEAEPGVYAGMTTRDQERLSLSTVDLLRDPSQTVPVRLQH
ncbi:DUF5719 family protein [Nesterenkonia sp. HG001]|uniref:DUF5719 family protein n=1 Tax=Nesterenkonia sp. HG001 TaxID=2983207 RepID=UPI002AC52038|nr:DUF5719 family protein [Nesterenkonia sp. HG001]MDZ5076961.1 DUF5719 family protein [Nesterenkonia sp. HG001]